MEHMADYTFDIVLTPAEEGGFVVDCPALSGCTTQGESNDEAIANIKPDSQLRTSDDEFGWRYGRGWGGVAHRFRRGTVAARASRAFGCTALTSIGAFHVLAPSRFQPFITVRPPSRRTLTMSFGNGIGRLRYRSRSKSSSGCPDRVDCSRPWMTEGRRQDRGRRWRRRERTGLLSRDVA